MGRQLRLVLPGLGHSQGLDLLGGVPPSGISPNHNATVLKFWDRNATAGETRHSEETERTDKDNR
eukprot:2436847-Amphidinium_carterae.1